MKSTLLTVLLGFFAALTCQAQLTQINSNKSLSPVVPLPNGKTILVSGVDSSIWSTDGTLAGTIQLSPTIFFKGNSGILNGKAIFTATTPATGHEIFITDGTVDGTMVLSDIVPGATGSSPDDAFALLGGYLYFTASRPAEGRELWRTNGTTAGTTLFKDIVAGPTGSNAADEYNLFSNGSYLLFAVNTGGLGSELWTSNGTDAGTMALADINTGAPSSNPDFFYALNNLVIFQATDAAHGTELWKTNGTVAGTSILKDINPGPGSSTPFLNIPLPFIFNNKSYFVANDGTRGDEVWYTDGTEGNTDILKDIQSGLISFTTLVNAVVVGNKFFFASTDAATRFEMWQSDGTPDGTELFMAFTPADFGGTPIIFPPYSIDFNTGTTTRPLFQGDKFFFSAGTADEGVELWVSDGTLAGTKMVKNIGPDENDGVALASTYAYTTDFFYFGADDGSTGTEIWKSDGTEDGTSRVADLNPGADGSDPLFYYIVNNNKLLITATDGVGADVEDLYVLEGVLPLPVNLLNFTVRNQSADALVQWSTSREINSRDFIVQRSDDGVHFTDIGTVAARGTASSVNSYQFTDGGIMNSGRAKVFYRLNQRNRDESSTFSSIISLHIKGKNVLTVRLHQNPVSSMLPVTIGGATGKVQLIIKDVSGKTVYASAATGNGYTSIAVDKLSKGIYILVAESDNAKQAFRFVKQ